MSYHIPKIQYGTPPVTITFTYPPEEEDPEALTSRARRSFSESGVSQTSLQHIEAIRRLKFGGLTEALYASLKTFFINHAAKGKSFRYFTDQDSAEYTTYSLEALSFAPKRRPVFGLGANTYQYDLPMNLRRVVDDGEDTNTMSFTLANNQSSAANVTGLIFDKTTVRSFTVYMEIFRKSTAAERIFSGYLRGFYREDTDTWSVQSEPVGEGETSDGTPHGVTFSITSAGQVQYVTDNMGGTGYEGRLLSAEMEIG